ncbi:MAG: hypothetical protein AB4206_14910 [Xenococcaceae cyanobacterium]
MRFLILFNNYGRSYGLKPQAQALLEILQDNPYQPPYEKLVGNLAGYYSRRINIQLRYFFLMMLTIWRSQSQNYLLL